MMKEKINTKDKYITACRNADLPLLRYSNAI